MFMPSYLHYWRGQEKTTSIVVGNTKQSIKGHFHNNKEQKRFLFIDNGHYPFGEKGKRQVAELLLDICRHFSEYDLIVKPRFLPDDKDVTHKNNVHLYNVLNEICEGCFPTNLVLLREHIEMEQLIESADTVICMLGSSVMDVVSRNKRIVILKNIENLDSVELNNKLIWQIEEKLFEKTNALVDYRETINYLPEGIQCSEQFVRDNAPIFGNKLAYEHVVDIIEFCFENFIKKGLFIKEVHTDAILCYSELMQDADASWESIIYKRYENIVEYLFSRYFTEAGIDIKPEGYEGWKKEKLEQIKVTPKVDFHEVHADVIGERFKMMVSLEYEARKSGTSESYWLEAVYNVARNDIYHINRESVICKRTYDFFYGCCCTQDSRFYEGLKYLKKYIQETSNIEFEEYVTDREVYLNRARDIIESIFPFDKYESEAKIILYGAGFWGKKFYKQIVEYGKINVVAIVDRCHNEIQIDGVDVIGLEQIQDYEYDDIFVTVKDPNARLEIENLLRKYE